MRYLVLSAMAIAIAGGFVMLKEALSEAGERTYSTLGFAATMLAGPLYLVWMTFAIRSLRCARCMMGRCLRRSSR